MDEKGIDISMQVCIGCEENGRYFLFPSFSDFIKYNSP